MKEPSKLREQKLKQTPKQVNKILQDVWNMPNDIMQQSEVITAKEPFLVEQSEWYSKIRNLKWSFK